MRTALLFLRMRELVKVWPVFLFQKHCVCTAGKPHHVSRDLARKRLTMPLASYRCARRAG